MVRRKITKQHVSQLSEVGKTAGTQLIAHRHGERLVSFFDVGNLGVAYLSCVVDAIEAVADSLAYDTARTRAYATKALLNFLATSVRPDAELARAAIAADAVRKLDPRVAHGAELAYGDHLRETYRRGSSTLAAHISGANSALSLLASRGLWPQTLRIPSEPVDIDQTDERPSLLESIGAPTDRIGDLRGEVARERAALRGLQRLGLSAPERDEELSAVVLAGERECLERLRKAASSVFDLTYTAWEAMQPRIAAAHTELDQEHLLWLTEAVAVVAARKRNGRFELRTSSLFPRSPQGLARFVALLDSIYMQGPKSWFTSIPVHLRVRVNETLRHVAYRVALALDEFSLPTMPTLEAIRGLLTPSHLCVHSAATLLMLETGMNTSPVISLPWDQVLETDDPHWISVANWKERAGGTLITEELEISQPDKPTSAGSALRKLRGMAARHKAFAGATDDILPLAFAYAAGHVGDSAAPSLEQVSPASFRQAFDSICFATFGARPLPTPSAVRPSLLMTVRGHTPSVRSAQAAAGHKSADTTFRSYTGRTRAAYRVDHTRAIRDFQDRLQVIAIHNLQAPAPMTNIEASQGTLNDAIKTGLGVLCLRPVETADTNPSPGCMSLENCPKCKRLKVSTAPDDLADLLAFGDHLTLHQAWLQTHRQEAWMTRWLFWSLLIDELQSRGARSAWAKNLKKAREIQTSRPKPSFPPLW